MLREWTPQGAALRSADSVALSYVAQAWLTVGDRHEARVLLRELARRHDRAFMVGAAPSLIHPGTNNPSHTVYAVTVEQVAAAFRLGGLHRAYRHALHVLERIPLVDQHGCIAYDRLDTSAGCIQDINGIAVAVLPSTYPGYARLVAYEQRTQLPGGGWWFWQDVAPTFWGHKIEVGHLAWTAYLMLRSKDPAVRAMGEKAAAYVSGAYDPASAPVFAVYAVAAADIASGRLSEGCALAKQLPGLRLDVKNMMWAASVYTWAQTRGCMAERRQNPPRQTAARGDGGGAELVGSSVLG